VWPVNRIYYSLYRRSVVNHWEVHKSYDVGRVIPSKKTAFDIEKDLSDVSNAARSMASISQMTAAFGGKSQDGSEL
jgi:hypothetical protein